MGRPDRRAVRSVPEQAQAPGGGMAEAIAALRARRDRYKAAGRLIEARAVDGCIRVLQSLRG